MLDYGLEPGDIGVFTTVGLARGRGVWRGRSVSLIIDESARVGHIVDQTAGLLVGQGVENWVASWLIVAHAGGVEVASPDGPGVMSCGS